MIATYHKKTSIRRGAACCWSLEFIAARQEANDNSILPMTTPKTTDQFSIACEYIAAGLSVIPLRLDGSKAPAVASWSQYQKRQATTAELAQWFSRPAGIGIICGVVSGGLEVIDFDHDADRIFPAWRESLPATVRAKLSVIETGGLGYHVFYRCENISGNEKLAKSSDKKTFIETRGEGGYVVGVGSPLEVHASLNPYVQSHGPVLPAISTISSDDRRQLWEAATAFDERAGVLSHLVEQRRRELFPVVQKPADGSAPWDDFTARASWADILEPAGWTTTDGKHWSRPGKSFGTSGAICEATDQNKVFTVFSSNAGPLSPINGDHQSWGKFSAYAALFHGGNKREAARC